MCEEAPESAHHSVGGVRRPAVASLVNTLAFSACSMVLTVLAVEELELEVEVDLLPLDLYPLDCCWPWPWALD